MKILRERESGDSVLAKSRGHLVGESAGDDHAVGLAGAGPEDDPESVEVVAGGAGVHHLDGAAGEPEGHGPDGATAGPVHQIVDLRDHELRRLGQPRRRRGRGRRRPRIGGGRASAAGSGGGERRNGGVEGEDSLGRELEGNPRRGSGHESHGDCRQRKTDADGEALNYGMEWKSERGRIVCCGSPILGNGDVQFCCRIYSIC